MIGWAVAGVGGLAAVGGTSLRAGARERRAARAHPPLGRVIVVNGRRVHALTRGSGPDLVLIHGASGNLNDFAYGLMPLLEQRFRCTAFDRPGFGYTDRARDGLDGVLGRDAESPMEQAALLRDAARALGIERPVVLGQSYGGCVALAWGLLDPDGTAAVVDMSGVSMPWPGTLDLLYRVNGSTFGGALIPPVVAAFWTPTLARRAMEAIFEPDPVPTWYEDRFGVPLTLRRRSIRANARQITTLRRHLVTMSAGYPGFRPPLEIVHGEADIIVPPGLHSQPLARVVPGANLVMLPDRGHMPHHSAPDAVVAAVERARARAGL